MQCIYAIEGTAQFDAHVLTRSTTCVNNYRVTHNYCQTSISLIFLSEAAAGDDSDGGVPEEDVESMLMLQYYNEGDSLPPPQENLDQICLKKSDFGSDLDEFSVLFYELQQELFTLCYSAPRKVHLGRTKGIFVSR